MSASGWYCAMKKMRVFALGSVAAVLAVLGCVAHVTACDEKPKGRNLQRNVLSFTVVEGPLEFVSFTPLSDGHRAEEAASLEAMDTLTLVGKEPLSLNKGDELQVGDTIESGTIISVGALSILLDSNDKEVILQSGEGVVVVEVETMLKGIDACAACAKLAQSICSEDEGKVKSVTCGADGSCAFTCVYKPIDEA